MHILNAKGFAVNFLVNDLDDNRALAAAVGASEVGDLPTREREANRATFLAAHKVGNVSTVRLGFLRTDCAPFQTGDIVAHWTDAEGDHIVGEATPAPQLRTLLMVAEAVKVDAPPVDVDATPAEVVKVDALTGEAPPMEVIAK